MAENQTIKKKDFIELNYTGKVSGTDTIFDTTNEELAKEKGIKSPGMAYGPLIVCIGERHLLRGLDSKLIGQNIGKHTFKLSPDEAFGKKNAKLIKLTATRKFLEKGIRPRPGMQVNIDGTVGTIRTASGGRTTVDFNHPLAGRELDYEVEVLRIVSDKKEQINAIMKLAVNINDSKVDLKEKNAIVTVSKKLPETVTKHLSEKLKDLTGLDVSFTYPGVKTEVKSEVKTEVNEEVKSEDKAEVKTEVNEEVKSEDKAEVKTEDEAEDSKLSETKLE